MAGLGSVNVGHDLLFPTCIKSPSHPNHDASLISWKYLVSPPGSIWNFFTGRETFDSHYSLFFYCCLAGLNVSPPALLVTEKHSVFYSRVKNEAGFECCPSPWIGLYDTCHFQPIRICATRARVAVETRDDVIYGFVPADRRTVAYSLPFCALLLVFGFGNEGKGLGLDKSITQIGKKKKLSIFLFLTCISNALTGDATRK